MNVLSFSIEPQKCSEWCWAAVTAAVCRCYGDPTPTQQGDVANIVLQLPIDCNRDCNCQEDSSAPCNQQQNLAAVLDAVNRHDRGNPVDGIPTLPFEVVQSDIDAGRPVVVQVTLDDPAASGHAVAIYGYTDDGMVSIADPMHPSDTISIPYNEFAQGNPTALQGTWKAAYRTKRTNE